MAWKLFYTTYISVDRPHHKIFRGKVSKGGLKTKFQEFIIR